MSSGKVFIFRHSEGEHESIDFKGNERDAILTPKGLEDAKSSGFTEGLNHDELLIGVWSSTRMRAIQTAALHAYAIKAQAEGVPMDSPENFAVKLDGKIPGNTNILRRMTSSLDYDWSPFASEIKAARENQAALDFLRKSQPEYVASRIKKQREILGFTLSSFKGLQETQHEVSKGYICGHSSDLELLLISLAKEFGTSRDLSVTWNSFPTGNGFAHNSGFNIEYDPVRNTAITRFGKVEFDIPFAGIIKN